MRPSGDGSTACQDNFDADYAGANFVFTATNHENLLMIYHGETRTFGKARKPDPPFPFYAQVGLARSADDGLTWTRLGAIISGSDPKPSALPKTFQTGVPEPGAIIAGNYIYVFYPYFSTPGCPDRDRPLFRLPVRQFQVMARRVRGRNTTTVHSTHNRGWVGLALRSSPRRVLARSRNSLGSHTAPISNATSWYWFAEMDGLSRPREISPLGHPRPGSTPPRRLCFCPAKLPKKMCFRDAGQSRRRHRPNGLRALCQNARLGARSTHSLDAPVHILQATLTGDGMVQEFVGRYRATFAPYIQRIGIQKLIVFHSF